MGTYYRLGVEDSGYGSLAIRGGSLVVTGTGEGEHGPSGMYVGVDGTAQLLVIGNQSEVAIAGVYQQNGRSALGFELVRGERHVTPIAVGGTATFAAGARLRVTLANLFHPDACGESFELMTAAGGIVDDGLRLVPPEGQESRWSFDTIGGALTVTYDPASSLPGC